MPPLGGTLPTALEDDASTRAQKELTPAQLDQLTAAATTAAVCTAAGQVLGVGLGAALAWRVNGARGRMLGRGWPGAQPTVVQFADGRMAPVLPEMFKPSRVRAVATYLALGYGGLWLGSRLGLWAGLAAGSRATDRDPELQRWVSREAHRAHAARLREELEKSEAAMSSITDAPN